jgi:hypothetical protein
MNMKHNDFIAMDGDSTEDGGVRTGCIEETGMKR